MMPDRIIINVEDDVQLVVVTRLHHPLHLMYQVQFEDGYENIFFTDPETGSWIEQDLGRTELAYILGEQLKTLSNENIKTRTITWLDLKESAERLHFGYHQYKISDFPAFEIYSWNKRYLYTLVQIETTTWQVFRLSGPGEWEGGNEIVETLPYILEKFIKY
jgi:hypothetical protein